MKRIAVSAGVVVVLLAVAALAVGGAGATAQSDDAPETDDSFGAEISSFMQASSAEAEGEVEDGMFGAAMARTDDPEERRALIERRQERLQQRQARLEDSRSRISAEDDPDVRDRALAARVTVGAAHLERSVNGTERVAQEEGVDTEALDEIRSNARNLRGPEVAGLARNLSGERSTPADPGPPIEVPGGGQPGEGPPVANRSNAPAPGDVGPGDGVDDGGNGSQGNGEGDRGAGAGGEGNGGAGNSSDDAGGTGNSGEGNADGQAGDRGPPDDDGTGEERGNAAGRSGSGG